MDNNRTVCCVKLCKTGRDGGEDLLCHEFPERGKSDVLVKRPNGEKLLMDRREVWKIIVDVDCVSKDLRVCTRHFRSSHYTMVFNEECPEMSLRPDAVPTCEIPGPSHLQLDGLEFNDHVELEDELLVNIGNESVISDNDEKHSEEDHHSANLSTILAGITDEKYKERLITLHILNDFHNYCAFPAPYPTYEKHTETNLQSNQQARHLHSPPSDSGTETSTSHSQSPPPSAKRSKTTKASTSCSPSPPPLTKNFTEAYRKVTQNLCCVHGCCSSSKKNAVLLFHNFPKRGHSVMVESDKGKRLWMDRRDLWRAMLRMGNIKAGMRVCSLHFLKTDYWCENGLVVNLKFEAFPTKNLPLVDELSDKNQMNIAKRLFHTTGGRLMQSAPLDETPAVSQRNISAFVLFKPPSKKRSPATSVLQRITDPAVILRLSDEKVDCEPLQSGGSNQRILKTLLQHQSTETFTSQAQSLVESAIMNTPKSESDLDVITIKDDEIAEVKTEQITIENEGITGIDYEQDAFLNQIDMFASSIPEQEEMDFSHVKSELDDLNPSSCISKKRRKLYV